MLAGLGGRNGSSGMSAERIVAEVERRRTPQMNLYVVLETLEYLKRGGRISPARAAIGSVLSVKPIITLEEGVVETADRPRTRSRARARLLELLVATKPERIAILHGQAPDIEAFAAELRRGNWRPARQDDHQPDRALSRPARRARCLWRGDNAGVRLRIGLGSCKPFLTESHFK